MLAGNAVLAARLEERVESQLRAAASRGDDRVREGLERILRDLATEARYHVLSDEGHKARAQRQLRDAAEEFQVRCLEHRHRIAKAMSEQNAKAVKEAVRGLADEVRNHATHSLALELGEAAVSDTSADLVLTYNKEVFDQPRKAPRGWVKRLEEWNRRLADIDARAEEELIAVASREEEGAMIALVFESCDLAGEIWKEVWTAFDNSWFTEKPSLQAPGADRASAAASVQGTQGPTHIFKPRSHCSLLLRMAEDIAELFSAKRMVRSTEAQQLRAAEAESEENKQPEEAKAPPSAPFSVLLPSAPDELASAVLEEDAATNPERDADRVSGEEQEQEQEQGPGDDASVRAAAKQLRIQYGTVCFALRGGDPALHREHHRTVLDDLVPIIHQFQQLELGLLRQRRFILLRSIAEQHRSAAEILP
jgi:hypothetical protein